MSGTAPSSASKGMDLGDPRLRRLLFRVGMPSMIGLSINALYQLVDMIFVGHLSVAAVSAVSAAAPLVLAMAALGEGVGVGAGAALSRALGAGEHGRVAAIVATAGALALGIGALLLVALIAMQGQVPLLYAGGTESNRLAQRYVGILLAGGTLILLQILCDFIAIAKGHTAFSMWTLITAFSVNLILDPILIFGLGWGVAGAAWATVIAAAVALVIYTYYFTYGPSLVRPRELLRRPTAALVRAILAIGGPAAGSTLMAALAFGLMYRAASPYGETAVAGMGISLRLLNAGILPMAGFCLGAQAVLGHSWGAGDGARTRRAVLIVLGLASAFAFTYATVMVTSAPWIVTLFTDAAAARAHALQAIATMHPAFALAGLPMVTTVLLRAKGHAKHAGLLALAPQGYLLLPGVLLLPEVWGFTGLLASHPLALTLAAVAAGCLLYRELEHCRANNAAPAKPPPEVLT